MSCRLLKNYNTIWLIFWKWLVFCYRIKLKNKHVLRKGRKDKKISRSIESNEIFRKNDRISNRSLSKTVRITFLIAGVQSQSRFFPTTFPFPILSFLFFFFQIKKSEDNEISITDNVITPQARNSPTNSSCCRYSFN